MLANYLAREESIIRKHVLTMGHETCLAIEQAMACYQSPDFSVADEIIDNDKIINELEARVEQECIQVIARQQPVAHDLRELLADMNIAKELERLADYATSIAKIIKKQTAVVPEIIPDVMELSSKSIYMLNEVMIDYADQDAEKAAAIARLDDEVDAMETQLIERVFELMRTNPEGVVNYTYQLWIIHQLERVADRVTNIAESVVFLATGKVVKCD